MNSDIEFNVESFFFKCLFLNIFRISPGLPNVTE